MEERQRLTTIQYVDTWLYETENWIYSQAQALPPERVRIAVVCEEKHLPERAPVERLFAPPGGPFWRLDPRRVVRRLEGMQGATTLIPRLAKRLNASVLHSHFGHVGLRAVRAAKMARMSHIVSFYGYDIDGLPNRLPALGVRYQRELFPNVDCVLCEGKFAAQRLKARGCPEDKIVVHHIGIPLTEYTYHPRVWSEREPLRVLICASFREKKGIPYALEALARIRAEVPLEITLIGDMRPGIPSQAAEKAKILATLDRYRLSECTRRLGYQPHEVLKREAESHHLFISTSITADDGDSEGGAPVTLIEMQALGVPVVSSFHCDIPSVVLHGVTGRLANERDVDDIVKQIRWWLDNRDQWRRLLDAGRAHVEAEYNVEKQGLRLAEIYARLRRG